MLVSAAISAVRRNHGTCGLTICDPFSSTRLCAIPPTLAFSLSLYPTYTASQRTSIISGLSAASISFLATISHPFITSPPPSPSSLFPVLTISRSNVLFGVNQINGNPHHLVHHLSLPPSLSLSLCFRVLTHQIKAAINLQRGGSILNHTIPLLLSVLSPLSPPFPL